MLTKGLIKNVGFQVVVAMVLGALVETIVLDNVAIYGTIIEQSLAFFGA